MAGSAAGHAGATATDVNERRDIRRRPQGGRRTQACSEGGLAQSAHRTEDHRAPQDDGTQEHGTQDHRTQEHGTQDDRATRREDDGSEERRAAQDDRTQDRRSQEHRAEGDQEDDPEAPLAR